MRSGASSSGMGAEHLPYLAHLRRLDKSSDVQRLADDADAIGRMLDSRGWKVLTELVSYVHGESANRLVFTHQGIEGKVLDQAEYARVLGFLAGLQQFKAAAESVLIHAERVREKEN
jgi:hypothetical protein